jgi:hypothetical protein
MDFRDFDDILEFCHFAFDDDISRNWWSLFDDDDRAFEHILLILPISSISSFFFSVARYDDDIEESTIFLRIDDVTIFSIF